MTESITSKSILDCWKKNEFPYNFDDLLERYLETKRKSFMDIKIRNVNEWMTPVILSIEVGLKRDYDRFSKHRDFWKLLFERRWDVNLRKEEVIFR